MTKDGGPAQSPPFRKSGGAARDIPPHSRRRLSAGPLSSGKRPFSFGKKAGSVRREACGGKEGPLLEKGPLLPPAPSILPPKTFIQEDAAARDCRPRRNSARLPEARRRGVIWRRWQPTHDPPCRSGNTSLECPLFFVSFAALRPAAEKGRSPCNPVFKDFP